MPTYYYICNNCKNKYAVVHAMNEKKEHCPQCYKNRIFNTLEKTVEGLQTNIEIGRAHV